jgi:hypothetical protein
MRSNVGIWRIKDYDSYQATDVKKRRSFNQIWNDTQQQSTKNPNTYADMGNIITGMQEQGMAVTLRRQMTDFGSPWRGMVNSLPIADNITATHVKETLEALDNTITEAVSHKPIDKHHMATLQISTMANIMRKNPGRNPTRRR